MAATKALTRLPAQRGSTHKHCPHDDLDYAPAKWVSGGANLCKSLGRVCLRWVLLQLLPLFSKSSHSKPSVRYELFRTLYQDVYSPDWASIFCQCSLILCSFCSQCNAAEPYQLPPLPVASPASHSLYYGACLGSQTTF